MRNEASQQGGKLRVALYGRVSTSDQNVDTQMEALRAHCARMGYEVAGEYVDNGFSGKDDRRPEFERLLAALRQGGVKTLVVYKSISQNIDTNTPEGRMFLKMLMVLAEYERELIVSRTVDGLARAKRQGKKLGKPVGRKDGRPRAKAGYYLRYMLKKSSPAVLVGV